MKQKIHKYLILFLLVFLSATIVVAEGGNKKGNNESLRKAANNPTSTLFNINDVSTWIYNNGDSDLDDNGNSGFEFPKGSGKTAVFQTGFLWGGKVDGQIRVGGSAYRHGLQPGAILPNGEAEPTDDQRIFRVRLDWKTANLDNDIAKTGFSEEDLRDQYEADWNEWPADKGAPFEDINGNGKYDPASDIPGVPGADQTIWYVANDLDEALTTYLYGSLPMGIEMQATFWGYNTQDALGKMMFRKYLLINKSDIDFTDMYVTIWSDVDLGGATDDFSGVDVDLSLAYTFNGTASDEQYGLNPPAIGFDFFQGPMIPGEPTDTAIFNFEKRAGFKNMPATAHYFFINSDNIYSDPPQGEYQGTLEFYNLMRGRIGTSGELFAGPPPNNEPTTFALWGDPQTNTGWIDGDLHGPGDRRQGMASGPFNMAAGDTQDIVVAEIAAGGFAPVDRLGSLGLLKFYDQSAQIAYDNLFIIPKAPAKPIVEVLEQDNEIVLSWYHDEANVKLTEEYADLGYSFEGYVVYQLPYRGATVEEATRVATFDLNNGFAKIFDLRFDPVDGVVTQKVVKFGSDSGIKRYISIKGDAFKSGAALLNGSKYYFSVTSYAIHEDTENIPRVLETAVESFEVIPQSPKPGVDVPTNSGDEVVTIHQGTSNSSVDVAVVNPTELTGDEYEVYFDEQTYYLDIDGVWKPVTAAAKGLHKDVSGSTLSGVAITATPAGTMNLTFTLTIESPNGAWVDGVVITLPDGISINSAETAETGGQHSSVYPVIDGQTVTWGHNELTEWGDFSSGEELHMNVDMAAVPFTYNYTIYDDGYAGADIIDAVGTGSIAEIGLAMKTVQHWNLKNKTTGKILLEDQPETNVDEQVFAASPVVEGFQIRVNGNYASPINFYSLNLNSPSGATELTSDGTTTTLDIQNYTIFGTISSWAYDNFGGIGTTSVDDLQQDYELRFTGVLRESELNDGRKLIDVESGGSMATIFAGVTIGETAEHLTVHPLNPNPGVEEAFMIRIPFEVWNVDDPDNEYQVNLTFRDREQDGSVNDPFYAWNIVDRMYSIIVNSPYNPAQVIQVNNGPDEFNAQATWVLVHYGTNYNMGDVVKITYANPIQLGKDKYNFTTEGMQFSQEKEVADLDKINVFPNPYYGVNPQEINKYNRFVTFSHLPKKAKITLVNLGGQIVRVLDKDSEAQFLQWDLANANGLPVASGLYLAYVDMPDQGITKILKVAIFQEQQVLDRF